MFKILITGASGFIGSFLVEKGIAEGMEVWAGVRPTSSRKWLSDERIRFVNLSFGNPDKLEEELLNHKEQHGAWDYVIHAAGATKCLHEEDFMNTNFEGTRNLVDTLVKLDMTPKKFIFVSSLSVVGPVKEIEPHMNITSTDAPQPNTAYGRSKHEAEKYLAQTNNFPYIILRPTGVYGPREKDYFMMFKSIKSHTDFAVGYQHQDLTFIYVADLVEAAFLAIKSNAVRRSYLLSDGRTYSSRAFSDLIQSELGTRFVVHIKAPLFVLRLISAIAETIGRITGKCSTLNGDKYKIMKQRNWMCDITPAKSELGYNPQFDLARGVHESVIWYKQEKWI